MGNDPAVGEKLRAFLAEGVTQVRTLGREGEGNHCLPDPSQESKVTFKNVLWIFGFRGW